MIKAFIFDMDGVIIDSEPIHFEVDLITLEYLGINYSKERLEQFVGMTNPEMWGVIKKEYNLTLSIDEIIEYQLSKKLYHLDGLQIEPISGIKFLLKALHKHNIAIGLASSSPRKFIEKVLLKFEINNYFSCVISGEEVEYGKPAPDVYLEAAHILNVDPEHCVVLEDSANGVKAAKRAGMRCIGYFNPNSGKQDLSAADIIVSSIEEITIQDLLKVGS